MLVIDDYTHKNGVLHFLCGRVGGSEITRNRGLNQPKCRNSLLERTGHLLSSCCFAHDPGQGSNSRVSVFLLESAGRHDTTRHFGVFEEDGEQDSFIAENEKAMRIAITTTNERAYDTSTFRDHLETSKLGVNRDQRAACDECGISRFPNSQKTTTQPTYCPRSNTFTPPSPPTRYRYSPSSITLPSPAPPPPRVILTTPLTSFAVPVSNNRKLSTASASCADDSTNAACSFSSVVACEATSGSSADTVRIVAWTFCRSCVSPVFPAYIYVDDVRPVE